MGMDSVLLPGFMEFLAITFQLGDRKKKSFSFFSKFLLFVFLE